MKTEVRAIAAIEGEGLPDSGALPLTDARANSVEMLSLAGKRVMLVEDNYLVAFDLQYELLDRGAEVIGPVGTLSAAFDLVESGKRVDAVLVDIDLDGECSFPLMDELVRRQILFAITTGCDIDVVPQHLGHVPIYSKPAPPSEIAEGLADLFRVSGSSPKRAA